MKLTLDATHSKAGQMKQLKTLMALLKRAHTFQDVSVRVVHHYAQQEWERNFTFKSLACGRQSCLRGHGGTIQRGDHIVVQGGSHITRYQVDEIDYDAQTPDAWIALMHPCSAQAVDCRFWMQPAKMPSTASV